MLLLATWQLLPGLDGTGVARSLSMCSWARERPYRRAREETGPSRRDGLCPLGCQDRLFLATLPTALPERGEAHEVELVADTKVSQAFVGCGDRVVTSPLSLGRDNNNNNNNIFY